ncbi:MAG: VanZ family protein [Polyangiales bacterium]
MTRPRPAQVMVPTRRRLVLWSLSIAYMALIFFASSIAWDVQIPSAFPLRDKGVHFCEYGLLGFLCAHAALGTWPAVTRVRLLAAGAFIATAWGLGDELHQAFVPGRSAEVLDLVADALGASAGAVARGFMTRLDSAHQISRNSSS